MAWQILPLLVNSGPRRSVQLWVVKMSDQVLQTLLGTAFGGVATWAAIKVEIRFLWRDVRDLKAKVEKLQEKVAKLV